MNMKRTMAAVLSAAMVLSVSMAASATDANATIDSAETATMQQVAPSMISAKVQILEVGTASLLIKEVLAQGSESVAQEIRLNLSEKTTCLDSKTGLASDIASIKQGDIVYATYSSAMTRSLPPQAACYSLVVNFDDSAAPAHFLVAEQVTKNDNGSVTVLAGKGSVVVTIGKETPVAPYKTRNIVKNTDITVGTNFYAWYDQMALSYPAQAGATKVVTLPEEYAPVEVKTTRMGAMDMTEYRAGSHATITEVASDRLTVKTENGDVMILETANALYVDDATGLPVSRDTLKKDAAIYVYYGDAFTENNSTQATAQLVLVNLTKDKAPAHMLTVEKVERNADDSVRILGDSGKIWVTVEQTTPIAPLTSKNVVKNSDLYVGTTVLVWYDAVKESLPAQTTATKVIVLPTSNTSFTVIREGDIAIAEGQVENGVAMVPLRKLAETLGFTVTWNGKEQSIMLTNGEIQSTVHVGQFLYFYSSVKAIGMSAPEYLGAAAYVKDGTTYVPAEFFNLLGASITLNGSVMYL